jgi:FAD/FMN-containing dehydrogenase
MNPDKLARPGTTAYDEMCASWNVRIAHHPDAVYAASSADEIAAAVTFATENGMPVRVQNTGHGAEAVCADGMLIRTGGLRGVSVDPEAGTANVRAGSKWIDVINAAYAYGLAPICGSSSDVGAVGFSLGGGAGWLARPYGLACDAIEAAQIVTADGNLRWVDAEHEPDLFWALQGGGPNFGIATELKIKLTPHADVYGGAMVWPVEQAAAVLPVWRDWIRGLPNEMTTTATILHAPDAPFVPEPMRGKSFVTLMMLFAGAPETGAALVEPLRRIDGLLMDQVGPRPFTTVDQVSQDPVDPLPHVLWSTMLRDVTDASIDDFVSISPRGAEPYTIMEIRHVGDGVRPAPDRQGLAHWSGDFLLMTITVTPMPEALAAAKSMAEGFDRRFADTSSGLVPLNFVAEPSDVGRAYTAEHMKRLLAIKTSYDPGNVFGGDKGLLTR